MIVLFLIVFAVIPGSWSQWSVEIENTHMQPTTHAFNWTHTHDNKPPLRSFLSILPSFLPSFPSAPTHPVPIHHNFLPTRPLFFFFELSLFFWFTSSALSFSLFSVFVCANHPRNFFLLCFLISFVSSFLLILWPFYSHTQFLHCFPSKCVPRSLHNRNAPLHSFLPFLPLLLCHQ